MLFVERVIPAQDVVPGDDARLRGEVEALTVGVGAVRVVQGTVIGINVLVRNVHAEGALGIDTLAEIDLHIGIDVDRLIPGAVEAAHLGIHDRQRMGIAALQIVAVLIVDRVQRRTARDSERSGAVHRTGQRLRVAVLDRVGIRRVGADGQELELAVEVQTSRKTLHIGTDHQTFGVQVAHAGVVTRLSDAARSAQVVILIITVTRDGVDPVVGRLAVPTVTRGNVIVPVVESSAGSGRSVLTIEDAVKRAETVGEDVRRLLCIGQFHVVVGHRDEALLDVDVEVEITLRTFLRRDDNHAVRGTRTVDGRCGGVFQHGNALDICGIDRSHRVEPDVAAAVEIILDVGVDRHAVDHVKGLSARVERSASAHVNRPPDTRRTGRVVHLETRHGAFERFDEVGIGPLGEDVVADDGCGAGKRSLALHTVAGHHDIFDRVCVFNQGDVHRRPARNGDRLTLIANERDDQRSVCRRGDGEAAVCRSSRTGRRSVDHNGCAGDGFPLRIGDLTGNLPVLGKSVCTKPQNGN